MGEVVSLNDPFTYIRSDKDDKIIGVMWKQGNNYLAFGLSGTTERIGESPKSHELRRLMIMWLALNCPQVLAFDEEVKESEIRNNAKDIG